MVLNILAAAVAAILAYNGLHMLLWPENWYHSLPSVPHTGPLNVHFVRDIGAAYLGGAIGMVIGFWKPVWRLPAAIPALVFIGLHALLHVLEWGHGHAASAHEGWLDRIGIYVPPVVMLVWMMRRETGAQHV